MFELLEHELREYSEKLAAKPKIYCLTKADVLGEEEVDTDGHPVISSVSGRGLEILVRNIRNTLKENEK